MTARVVPVITRNYVLANRLRVEPIVRGESWVRVTMTCESLLWRGHKNSWRDYYQNQRGPSVFHAVSRRGTFLSFRRQVHGSERWKHPAFRHAPRSLRAAELPRNRKYQSGQKSGQESSDCVEKMPIDVVAASCSRRSGRNSSDFTREIGRVFVLLFVKCILPCQQLIDDNALAKRSCALDRRCRRG